MDRIHKLRAVQEHFQLNIKIHSVKLALPYSAGLQVVLKRGKRKKKQTAVVDCDKITGVTFFDADIHFPITMYKRFDRFLEKKVSLRVVAVLGNKNLKDGKAIVNISSLVQNRRVVELKDFPLYGGSDKQASVCVSIMIEPTDEENPHHIVRKNKVRNSFLRKTRTISKRASFIDTTNKVQSASSCSDDEIDSPLLVSKNYLRRTTIGGVQPNTDFLSYSTTSEETPSNQSTTGNESAKSYLDRCPQNTGTNAIRASFAAQRASVVNRNAEIAMMLNDVLKEKPHKRPQKSGGELGAILHPQKVEVTPRENQMTNLKASIRARTSSTSTNFNSNLVRGSIGIDQGADFHMVITPDPASPCGVMEQAKPNGIREGLSIEESEDESKERYGDKACSKCEVF
jgi:hypothetical protein